MSKIFVTGGSGRLGRYVVRALLNTGHSIVALSREKNIEGCTMVRGDVFDFDHSLIRGCEWAVHIAGSTDMSQPYSSLYRINVEGTKSIVERCGQAGIKKLIYISSISVYGKRDNRHITESTTLNPDTVYARTKFEGELITKNFVGQVCTLRPSIIYGNGFDAGFRMAYEMIRKGRMAVFGDGKNHIPLVHASDVADAIVNAIDRNATGIYNINNDREMTQGELVDYVAELTGAPKKYMHIPSIISRPALALYNLSRSLQNKRPIPYEFIDMLATDRVVIAEKARVELGLKNVELRKGISEFVDYLSKSAMSK